MDKKPEDEAEEVFEVDMDMRGRLVVPSHIRRELGVYRKEAKVKVSLTVERVYNSSTGTTLSEVPTKTPTSTPPDKAEVVA